MHQGARAAPLQLGTTSGSRGNSCEDLWGEHLVLLRETPVGDTWGEILFQEKLWENGGKDCTRGATVGPLSLPHPAIPE